MNGVSWIRTSKSFLTSETRAYRQGVQCIPKRGFQEC